MLYLNEIGLEC